MRFPGLLRASGFTLIEVISVLLLVGIVGAMLIRTSTGGFGSGNKAVTSSAILKSDLRHAQLRAMNSGPAEAWSIVFGSSTSYTLQQYDSAAGAWVDRNLPGVTTDTDGDGLFETRNLESGVSKTAGAGTIRFDHWGIPVQADRVTPEAATLTVTLGAGDASATVTITKNTGFIP